MKTLFAPTPYYQPHIGHAYCCFQNWELAHRSGDDFVLLLDDIHYRRSQRQFSGFSLEGAVERYIDQLSWLGCVPDRVCRSSENQAAHQEAFEKLALKPILPGYLASRYQPAGLVVTFVVDDFLAGAELTISGREFEETAGLYQYLCQRLGYRVPEQRFIPLVRREGALLKESQSQTCVSLDSLRLSGYTPDQIISTLQECDKRSRAAGLEHTVVPKGYLMPGSVRWLEFSGFEEALDAAAEFASGKAWQADVIAATQEIRRNAYRPFPDV